MADPPQSHSKNAANNESVNDSDGLAFSDLDFTPSETPQNDVVMDLLDNLIVESDNEFGVVEGNDGDLGMDVDIRLGLDDVCDGNDEFYVRRRGGIGCNNCGFVISDCGDEFLGSRRGCGIGCNNCGFVVADCGDEFFVSRRGNDGTDGGGDGFVVVDFGDEFFVSMRGSDETVADYGEEFWMSRRAATPDRADLSAQSSRQDRSVGSLTVADIGLESNYRLEDQDEVFQLCLDTIHLEDARGVANGNGNGNVNENVIEGIEWEEVNERLDMEVLSMFLGDDNDDNASPVIIRGEDMDEEVGWEVLSNVYDFVETYPEGYESEQERHDEYFAELEIFIEQFADNDSPLVGRPPAATRVMENLLSVVITREDVEGGNAHCAVCKDEISVGNVAKQLPCAHRYHGDCIVPWLSIRNTCPVCRHELPTDDSEYERRRAERSRH